MIDYWLLANILTFALLLVAVFVWVKSFLTLADAWVNKIAFYQVSPHTDTNIRASGQADLLLNAFIHLREAMIFRVVLSTLVALGIIFVRHLLEVFHAVL